MRAVLVVDIVIVAVDGRGDRALVEVGEERGRRDEGSAGGPDDDPRQLAVGVGATAVVTLVEQQTRAATLGTSVIDAAGQTRQGMPRENRPYHP